MKVLPVLALPALAVSILSLAACTTPAMRVDRNLQLNAPPHAVEGRQGWLIGQQLSFGEYRSTPVKRSWTRGYDIPFIVRFSGAREKLGYTMRDGAGSEAEVFCVGKLSEQDLPVFNRAFEVNLNTTDVFTCAIVVDGDHDYEFYAADLNRNAWSNPASGGLEGDGIALELRPVTELASGQRSWGTEALGFEFVLGSRAVGAVETVDEGRVWLSDDLAASHRLAVAAAAAGLLLRSGLADHNDNR